MALAPACNRGQPSACQTLRKPMYLVRFGLALALVTLAALARAHGDETP